MTHSNSTYRLTVIRDGQRVELTALAACTADAVSITLAMPGVTHVIAAPKPRMAWYQPRRDGGGDMTVDGRTLKPGS